MLSAAVGMERECFPPGFASGILSVASVFLLSFVGGCEIVCQDISIWAENGTIGGWFIVHCDCDGNRSSFRGGNFAVFLVQTWFCRTSFSASLCFSAATHSRLSLSATEGQDRDASNIRRTARLEVLLSARVMDWCGTILVPEPDDDDDDDKAAWRSSYQAGTNATAKRRLESNVKSIHHGSRQ
jgi:hypothetical protein